LIQIFGSKFKKKNQTIIKKIDLDPKPNLIIWIKVI